jgi:hypothetical protein
MAAAARVPSPPLLRVAAAWGTTIVSVRLLDRGHDCVLGEVPGALAAMPEGLAASATPLRAVAGGWELDARGAVNGKLVLRGREEDVSGLAHAGAPIPVVPGDHGLIQYGLFSIFFQYTGPAEPMRGRIPFDWLGLLALFSSLVFHLGIIGLLIINWTPPEYHLPPELIPDFASQFHLSRALAEWQPAPAVGKDDKGGGKDAKDLGAKDTKKPGGGQKIAGNEGKGGLNGKEGHTELPGEIRPTTTYGGLSEALADTGTDIRKTLAEIRTVADALGGLNSSNVVLGSGPGTGLRGTGSGGGGVGAGVMFGSGTMSTGWGAGTGGGFGAGSGAGAGHGGGFGGGTGTGTGGGNGPGEHGIQAAGGAVVHGGLSPDQIHRVVMAHRGALRACYETEAEKDPTLKGGLSVTWTIDPSGAVTSANVASTTIHNARVEGCVLRQVRNWRFPASDSPSLPTYPFRFGIGQ